MNSIVTLTGPMGSGKSATFIDTVREYRKQGYKTALYKPGTDTRSKDISSRNGESEPCTIIPHGNTQELFKNLFSKPMVIGLDEAQFFSDKDLPGILLTLASRGHIILISGLNLTSERTPFGMIPKLMAISEEITILKGECANCGSHEGIYTYAKFDKGRKVAIGGDEKYSCVCKECYSHLTSEPLTEEELLMYEEMDILKLQNVIK